jgi:hypothetical protein
MGRDRIAVLLWAVSLGVTTGLVVGAVVRTPTALSEVQFSFAVTVSSGLALGGLVWTRWDDWIELGGWLGIAVYFSTLFVGSVVFGEFFELVVTGDSLGTLAQLLGSVVAFAVAVWLCFYGGSAVTVSWLAARLDLEI